MLAVHDQSSSVRRKFNTKTKSVRRRKEYLTYCSNRCPQAPFSKYKAHLCMFSTTQWRVILSKQLYKCVLAIDDLCT